MAVHPISQGFGWVLFENAHSPIAWAVAHTQRGRNAQLLSRFKHLLDRYEPAVLVIEDFEGGELPRVARIRQFCEAILDEAERRNIKTRVFTREVVRKAFAPFGAKTRAEIARVIADRVEDISHRLPPPRRLGYSIDPRQSLFDAAALAVTYFVAMGDEDWPN